MKGGCLSHFFQTSKWNRTRNLLPYRGLSSKKGGMKRLHLRIIYALLWVLTTGLFIINVGHFRQIADRIGQAGAIAWFMVFFGPAFFALYLLTAFLFDVRQDVVTAAHVKTFLYRRRLPIGLLLFSMIIFVILTFYGVSFKR